MVWCGVGWVGGSVGGVGWGGVVWGEVGWGGVVWWDGWGGVVGVGSELSQLSSRWFVHACY